MTDEHLGLVLPAQDYDRLCKLARVQRTTLTALVRIAVQSAPAFPNKGERVRLGIRVSPPIAGAARAKAEASGMTTTGFVRAAVQSLLERHP